VTEQRHEIFPSLLVSAPEDYPEPTEGQATAWTLMTPDGDLVGTLIHNGGGLSWTPTDTEDEDTQEYAAEILQFLRGNRAQETPLSDVLTGISVAYAGDYDEASVTYTPTTPPAE
jgi:hypothetical protein